jgi:hypothetical protein
MRDPFVEASTLEMTRDTDENTGAQSANAAQQLRVALAGRQVCAFCGQQRSAGPEPCPHCTMEDSPATRQATKARIGPWYVLQSRNPAAPGMKYATLLALIHRGHVTAKSVVRGPTTHQLWRFAAHVRGVSREFDVCYSCGGTIDRSASLCPHCQRVQDPPSDPDVLLEQRAARARPEEDAPSHSQRLNDLNRARVHAERKRNGDANHQVDTDLAVSHDSRVLSGMNLAAALQIAREPAHRSRWRKLKIAMVLLMFGGLLTAGVLYARPELRERAVVWFHQTWESVQTRWKGASETRVTPRSLPVAPTYVPREVQPTTHESVPESIPAPVVMREPEQPAPEPPQPIQTPPRTEPEPPPKPAPVVSVDPYEQSRTLWRAAIDAEARRDFAGAAQLYIQIKQLPSEVWPAGLQLRLDLAQKRAGQTSAK